MWQYAEEALYRVGHQGCVFCGSPGIQDSPSEVLQTARTAKSMLPAFDFGVVPTLLLS
jgi:hypothetical protein